jgi:polyphenol oxidase
MSFSNLPITTDNLTWQWCEKEGLPYLTCELLKDWQHGFFTQQCYPRTPETLIAILNSQATVDRVKQVHGNTVLTPQEIASAMSNADATFPEADGVITDAKQQGVWVASADCNPVLVGDRSIGRVAAIHAGWRGTAQKILPNAIARFLADGSSLTDLLIAMGPAITKEVYQVSETVAVEVGKSILEDGEQSSKEEALQALFELENSPLSKDEQPGRVKLDVRRVNQIQLEQLGISNQQIAIAPYCTYPQPDYFFSYRRTKEKKVQWSGIVSC